MPRTRAGIKGLWKAAEERLANLFGVSRRALSGDNSKSGGTDDALHETLYLESKYQKQSALWTLYRETRAKAKKEGRVPVLGIQESRSKGVLLVIHDQDLLEVLREYHRAWTRAELKRRAGHSIRSNYVLPRKGA